MRRELSAQSSLNAGRLFPFGHIGGQTRKLIGSIATKRLIGLLSKAASIARAKPLNKNIHTVSGRVLMIGHSA